MTTSPRPLAGWRVGISVSGTGHELTRRGFTEAGVNRLTVRLARALLSEGAALAFGHDWREGGIMEAIASIALDYQLATAARSTEAPILNLIPWPDAAATDPVLLARLAGVVEVVPAGLPDELRAMAARARGTGRASDDYRYLRARGLTHLRRELARRCHARVALGGRLTGYDGRLPGIVEEVFVTYQADRPVYLAGLLGGAAEIIGKAQTREASRQALEGQDPQALAAIYGRQAAPSRGGLDDRDLNAAAIVSWLARDEGVTNPPPNGLLPSESSTLLHTDLEEEVIHLVVLGLKRLATAARVTESPRAPGQPLS